MLLHFVLELGCSIILATDASWHSAFLNLQSRTEKHGTETPPTPPKSMLKSREEKNAPFCILDLGGRGGLSVPFKNSEIVGSAELRDSGGGGREEEGGLLINVWVHG